MKLFRILLIVLTINIFIYTLYTGINYGWNLFSIFFTDIFNFTWAGQFNTDFISFLVLSALWTSWRQKFSSNGLLLAIIALVGGIMFLAPYLLYLTYKNENDIHKVILGENIKH